MIKKLSKQRLLTLLSIVLLNTACVHVPESLRLPEESVLTNFADVRVDKGNHQGNLARWGGVIAKVENKSKQTMLEIVHFDLKSSLRPAAKDETQGRFRVYYDGLLDPVIFKEGRSVTVVGNIAPSEQGKIGEHEYLYPVLNGKNVHLWKEIKQVDVRVTHQPLWYRPSLWYLPRGYYAPIYPAYGNKKPTKVKK